MKKITYANICSMIQRLYEAAGGDSFFNPPQVKIASADDPWFEKYKKLIGSFHWTPQEALELKHPDKKAKSVIAWVLPVKKMIRDANAAETEYPAVSWAAMRSFGELCNENIARQLCGLLEKEGYAAAPPHLEQTERGFKVGDFDFCSHWSERHVGFVAGLGTFGMSAGLITEHGVAERLGSIVTDLELPASERPYGDDPWGWCIRCGACARRCPANAIGNSPEERDKGKCAAYAYGTIGQEREKRYGWLNLSLGCGLCQTKVPCEDRIPDGARGGRPK